MNNTKRRNVQNGLPAVDARSFGAAHPAAPTCNWSFARSITVKRTTMNAKHHGLRPEETSTG